MVYYRPFFFIGRTKIKFESYYCPIEKHFFMRFQLKELAGEFQLIKLANQQILTKLNVSNQILMIFCISSLNFTIVLNVCFIHCPTKLFN